MIQRSIKFRAWDKVDKMWVEFFGVENSTGWLFENGANYLPFEPHDRFILQQFTGLHDKNGKEIYEGDIVATQSYSWNEKTKKHDIPHKRHIEGVVQEGEYTSSSHDMGGGKETTMIGWLMGSSPLNKYVEVIGNVYENPELIKNDITKKTNP